MRTQTKYGLYWLITLGVYSLFFTATGGMAQIHSNTVPVEQFVGGESSVAQPAPPAAQPTPESASSVLPALELIRQERDATLSQYAANVTAQLDLLKQTFAAQHEQAVVALQQTNRLALVAAGVLFGTVVLVTFLLNLISLRAMNRLVVRITANPLVQVLFQSQPHAWSAGENRLPATDDATTNARLECAIERLEQRLLTLEGASLQPQLPGLALTAGDKPKAASPPPPASGSTATHSNGRPHLALAFGTGEALCFLPREISRAKFHFFSHLLAKVRRPFQAIRAAKGS